MPISPSSISQHFAPFAYHFSQQAAAARVFTLLDGIQLLLAQNAG
jgi:hypothetical protein